MIVGIDVGGTNTDAAIVSDEIKTIKLPNEIGIGGVLKEVSKHVDLKKEKLVVSTSLPLNLIISKFDEIKTLTLLIPGPGLNYSHLGVVLKGYVNHRGDVVEEIDESEIRKSLDGKYDNLAIAAKFSVRNSVLEEKVSKIAEEKFSKEKIALSHFVGGLNYPARINTTVVNAKVKETAYRLTELIRSYAGDFYYFKGDGGIVPYKVVLENPSELYNSSPAAVALGASYLTGEKDALVVDIGGTSTDFVRLKDGMPVIVEGIDIAGRKTLIRCVDSFSIPFGGDSLVSDGKLRPERIDRPIAFGGSKFTLTDALNCLGHEIGDYRASREAGRGIDSESVVDQFISVVSENIAQIGYKRVIGAGYLAPILIPEISRRCGADFVVPEHSEAVNAVGVAVSRLSLTIYARFDTEKGSAAFNGIVEECPFRKGSIPDDSEIIEAAKEKIRKFARELGASEEDIGRIKVIYYSSFVVVRGGIKRGVISDVVVQIEPGIREI